MLLAQIKRPAHLGSGTCLTDQVRNNHMQLPAAPDLTAKASCTWSLQALNEKELLSSLISTSRPLQRVTTRARGGRQRGDSLNNWSFNVLPTAQSSLDEDDDMVTLGGKQKGERWGWWWGRGGTHVDTQTS